MKTSDVTKTNDVTSMGLQLYSDERLTFVTAKGTINSRRMIWIIKLSSSKLYKTIYAIRGIIINFIILTCKISFLFSFFSLTLYKNIPKIINWSTIEAYAPICNDVRIEGWIVNSNRLKVIAKMANQIKGSFTMFNSESLMLKLPLE